jgi:hypothetical protein
MVKKGFVSKDELMGEYKQLLKEAGKKQGK